MFIPGLLSVQQQWGMLETPTTWRHRHRDISPNFPSSALNNRQLFFMLPGSHLNQLCLDNPWRHISHFMNWESFNQMDSRFA